MRRVLLVSCLGALAAASPATGAVVKVTSSLPDWLAPGGRLVITGWAGPSERVTLRSQSRALARVWAGPRGGFRIRAQVREPGRTPSAWLQAGSSRGSVQFPSGRFALRRWATSRSGTASAR